MCVGVLHVNAVLVNATQVQKSSVEKSNQQWTKYFHWFNKTLLRGRYEKRKHEKQKKIDSIKQRDDVIYIEKQTQTERESKMKTKRGGQQMKALARLLGNKLNLKI